MRIYTIKENTECIGFFMFDGSFYSHILDHPFLLYLIEITGFLWSSYTREFEEIK